MGLHDRPLESSRQPGSSQKARRNLSLKFRLDLELHERRRPCFGAGFGPKEIKVAPDGNAAAQDKIKRLQARIVHLYPSFILAVLDPSVMHLQLPLGRYHIVSAKTFV